jgi:hypothetical protein
MHSLISAKAVSVLMIVLSGLLVLSGGVIMFLGTTKKEWKYTPLVALIGGLFESIAGLIFIAFSIAFLL